MKMLRGIWAALLAVSLVACGGGGGSSGSDPFPGNGNGGDDGGGDGGTGTPTATLEVELSLSTATVTIASPATVTATVTDGGSPVSGQLVTFQTANELGAFSPASGTALTNEDGEAVIALAPATPTAAGADEITASVTVNGTTATATRGFQLSASDVEIESFTSAVAGNLSPYGQADLTVQLSEAASGTAVSLGVTSTCIAAGKATISPATATITTGRATFTYKDGGCGATQSADTLTATVTGTAISDTLQQRLTSPTASSIAFVSATPETIFLKGSGLGESSEVIFQVKDSAGNPLPNQDVELELTTLAGGLTMEGGRVPVVRRSNDQGRVSVLINSGTVPTPVRVRATLDIGAVSVSTVSSSLTIGVGLPSQLNFSLAQGTINIEGYNYIDTPNTYTVIAADRSGNPVPAGTAINFVAEGGQVQSSRSIAISDAGIARATANFVSSQPTPVDGRATIVAYALGEESFKDNNGNNVYDAGEPFQDLGNIYRDRWYDGTYDAGQDEFVSLDIAASGACSPTSDPLFALTANIPTMPRTCDGAWGRAYVRRAVETVFSTSAARPLWLPGDEPADHGLGIQLWTSQYRMRTDLLAGCGVSPDVPTSDDCPNKTIFFEVDGSTIVNAGGGGSVFFLLADANDRRLNPVAATSTVAVTATEGLAVELTGGSPVPSTSDATGVSFTYKFDDTTAAGVVTIRITSPRGLITTVGLAIER